MVTIETEIRGKWTEVEYAKADSLGDAWQRIMEAGWVFLGQNDDGSVVMTWNNYINTFRNAKKED